MRRFFLLIAIAAIVLAAGLTRGRALAAQRFAPGSAPAQNDAPPTDAQLRALIDRVLANQHADDDALPVFERVEHRQVREHASDPSLAEDKTYRVIPIGTGTGWRVLTEDHGHSVSSADYQAAMVSVERALEIVTDPANMNSKRDIEKFRRRLKDRADLLTSAREGFTFSWLGRETHAGRILEKFRMEPNPNFKPYSRETEVFLHASATLWVDEATSHVARIDAELTSDYGIGGGIIGKVYRGSHMTIEQTEVAPGVWLPSVYEYNLTGRKFVFGSEFHERTDASHYERIGPPSEALARIRRELSPALAPRAQQ
ncbi:MAG: hypothetical protein WAM91_02200 [Candidatus Acidiferrales bacterium]